MSAADGLWREALVDDGGGRPHVRAEPATWTPTHTTLIDMTGVRAGRWTVLHRAETRRGIGAAWVCQCDCGTVRVVDGHTLRRRAAGASCGCVKRPRTPRTRRPGDHARDGVVLSTSRWPKHAIEAGRMEYPAEEHASYQRPATRGDCLPGGVNEARPCPFVSCTMHLALDVTSVGSIRVRTRDLDVSAMAETCALDVADRGPSLLVTISEVLSVTRQRVEQMEKRALARAEAAALAAHADEYLDDSPDGPHVYSRPTGGRATMAGVRVDVAGESFGRPRIAR